MPSMVGFENECASGLTSACAKGVRVYLEEGAVAEGDIVIL